VSRSRSESRTAWFRRRRRWSSGSRSDSALVCAIPYRWRRKGFRMLWRQSIVWRAVWVRDVEFRIKKKGKLIRNFLGREAFIINIYV
jgi:hypothetical protein